MPVCNCHVHHVGRATMYIHPPRQHRCTKPQTQAQHCKLDQNSLQINRLNKVYIVSSYMSTLRTPRIEPITGKLFTLHLHQLNFELEGSVGGNVRGSTLKQTLSKNQYKTSKNGKEGQRIVIRTLEPYAKAAGIVNFLLPPTAIPFTPISHPRITSPAPSLKVKGLPFVLESKTLPFVSLPM